MCNILDMVLRSWMGKILDMVDRLLIYVYRRIVGSFQLVKDFTILSIFFYNLYLFVFSYSYNQRN